jgi:prolipoprotein diacylglyceryltransferase
VINPYGLIISIAIFVSIKVAEKIIEKENEDVLWGLSLWAIVIGIIGARLYHVLDYFDFILKAL